LRAAGKAEDIYDRTGLVLDAYFSASKLAWLLDAVKQHNDPPVDLDETLAGTVDSWVLWNLTGGKVHATDHSNASRTMLLNIHDHNWDPGLLLAIQHSTADHADGQTQPGAIWLYRCGCGRGRNSDYAIFGDQQSALFGHGCDRPGALKCTYGTGAFLVAHTGNTIARSSHQLLSTIAWSSNGVATRPRWGMP
jgi:glycerol kinase